MHLPCAVSHAAVPRHSGPGQTVGHRSFDRWLRASASWWRGHCEGTCLALHLPHHCHHTIPTVPYYPLERIGAQSRWCVHIHTYNTAMNQHPVVHMSCTTHTNQLPCMYMHSCTHEPLTLCSPSPIHSPHTMHSLQDTNTVLYACVQYQNEPQAVLSWPGSDWQAVALCLHHQWWREHCGSE